MAHQPAVPPHVAQPHNPSVVINNNLLLSGKPKPWLNKDPKPWQNPPSSVQPIPFEVLESKRPASAEKKEKEEECLVLSCEDTEIVIPEAIARISGLVCSILDSAGDYIEKKTRKIRFDHISGPVLEEIFRFCTQECQENPSFLQSIRPPSPPSPQKESEGVVTPDKRQALRTSFVFELKPDIVMELMSAAEYLQIPSLVNHIISMLAAYADDVPSFEGMSEGLIEQICNRCKPSVLRKIELDGKLDPYEKDFTTENWRRFCGEYQDVVATSQKEIRAKEMTYNRYTGAHNNNNNHNNNANDNNDDEGSDKIDWRRGYAELTLEKIMAKMTPEEIETELRAFAPLFGSVVRSLRLYHGHIDPILLSASCPNLRFLEIVGSIGLHEAPIGTLVSELGKLHYFRISNNGASQGFWREFLGAIEKSTVRELDISSNEINQHVASAVAGLLRNNPNISVLNIANNPIQMEGFMEIATAGVNLQVLDASDCGISTSQKTEEALFRAPVLVHFWRVLKLSGNNFVKMSSSFWQWIFTGQKKLFRLDLARVMWVQRDKDTRNLICHIAEFPNIEYLDLSDNHIAELAMEAICFNLLLAPRVPLKTLVLSGNTVKDSIAAMLARALRYNSCLQTLVLPSVSHYGVMELDTAISENSASAIRSIIISSSVAPSLLSSSPLPPSLSHPHLFSLVTLSDPTFTFQMRWNPQQNGR